MDAVKHSGAPGDNRGVLARVGGRPLEIRRATVEDRPAILRAYEASVTTLCASHHTPQQIQALLNQRQVRDYEAAVHNALVLVAEDNQKILGFTELDLISGRILAVYVHPDHVGHGVGGALLAALEKEARTTGLRRLCLDATLNSVAFLQSRGFLPLNEGASTRPTDSAQPCVQMEKWLAEPPVNGVLR